MCCQPQPGTVCWRRIRSPRCHSNNSSSYSSSGGGGARGYQSRRWGCHTHSSPPQPPLRVVGPRQSSPTSPAQGGVRHHKSYERLHTYDGVSVLWILPPTPDDKHLGRHTRQHGKGKLYLKQTYITLLFNKISRKHIVRRLGACQGRPLIKDMRQRTLKRGVFKGGFTILCNPLQSICLPNLIKFPIMS